MKDATKITEKTNELDNDHLQTASNIISQVWLGGILLMAALIGVWGFLCLASGLIDGGLINLLKGWFLAVGG